MEGMENQWFYLRIEVTLVVLEKAHEAANNESREQVSSITVKTRPMFVGSLAMPLRNSLINCESPYRSRQPSIWTHALA
jgi:hypothetical protein